MTRFLIVDDNVHLLGALKALLEEDGHQVAAFTDPTKALVALEGSVFDIVVTDLEMPQMRGDELGTKRWEELSDTDALTGLSNRRSFDRRLDLELSRTWRSGVESALVMIDLDKFKVLNDRFGHRAGDEVLRRVGSILNTEKRAGDLVVRYGGEEFAAILSDTTIGEAINWAERARQRIAACRIAWGASNLNVTASFGIAGATSWAVTKEQLIESADQMLYAAKGRGRNIVVPAPDPAKERPGAGPQHPRLHAA